MQTFQTIVFLKYELQAKWIAQVLSGKVVLPSKEEMLAVVEDHNRHLEEAGIPKHHTHLLHPHEVIIPICSSKVPYRHYKFLNTIKHHSGSSYKRIIVET